MKKSIRMLCAVFFILMMSAFALAGYQRTPWGSKTWTGPERPPHFSTSQPTEVGSAVKPRHHAPGSPGYKTYKNADYPAKKRIEEKLPGGFYKDQYNRWRHHKYRQPGYIYHVKPSVKEIVIEREKPVKVYVPVPVQKKAPVRCGGQTIARTNPQTGELVITYVTRPKQC